MSNIRNATIEDLADIVNIYNQAISKGFQTADISPVEIEERKLWFEEHSHCHYPIYVYIDKNEVVGWLSISPYRKGREALRFTAEVSYYIDENHQKQGIGSRLLQHAIQDMPKLGLKTLFAILLDVNQGSKRLLEKFGFDRWGYLPNIAEFKGQMCGQFYYGFQIKDEK